MKGYQVIIFCFGCILPNIQSSFSRLSFPAALSQNKKTPTLKCEVLPAYKIIKAKAISATNPVDFNQNSKLYTSPTEYCCGKYFPEVEYPESILDTFTPFYYKPQVYDVTAGSLTSKSISHVGVPTCAKVLNVNPTKCGVKAKSTKCLIVSKENSTIIQEIPCREIFESNSTSNNSSVINPNKDETIILESEDKEGTVEVIEVTCLSTTENNANNSSTVCYIVSDNDSVLCALDIPNEVIAEESITNDSSCIQQTNETSNNCSVIETDLTNEALTTQTETTTLQEENGKESVAVDNNINNPVIENILLTQTDATPEIVENFTIVSELLVNCEGVASLETIEVVPTVLSLEESTFTEISNTSVVEAPVESSTETEITELLK